MLSEEAIAHHAALTGAVKVKPLVWLLEQDDVLVSNTSGLRQYRIAFDGRAARVCLRNGLWVKCETEDGAKAVAQADYEARILSTLEPVRNAERAELARQNAALRAQVASLTADNEALQRTVAKTVASAEAAIQALRLHQAWSDSEDAGPDYGDQSRDTHPDGERIWRQWWEGNLSLCARAQDETRNALAAWEASK